MFFLFLFAFSRRSLGLILRFYYARPSAGLLAPRQWHDAEPSVTQTSLRLNRQTGSLLLQAEKPCPRSRCRTPRALGKNQCGRQCIDGKTFGHREDSCWLDSVGPSSIGSQNIGLNYIRGMRIRPRKRAPPPPQLGSYSSGGEKSALKLVRATGPMVLSYSVAALIYQSTSLRRILIHGMGVHGRIRLSQSSKAQRV